MGRYVSSGEAQANLVSTIEASECYQVPTHKYAYDANETWQNKVTIDTPGNYTFTVPSGVTCMRTIAVGGGGKSYCTQTCCGYAVAGGAYAEKWDTVQGGCTVTVVVGKQQQDTTISYTNSGGSAINMTAGGAIGCTYGTASGGDINSCGGCAGKNCSCCGGSYSHYCGSCIYTYSTTCCGYCVVWSGISARQLDPNHNTNGCCVSRYSGGGSAGSWLWCHGGAGQSAANCFCSSGCGPTGGGGGGIGYICRQEVHPWRCDCICMKRGYNGQCYGKTLKNAYHPPSVGGGGGSKFQCWTCCEGSSIIGFCMAGRRRNGHGGLGGESNNEGRGHEFIWGFGSSPNEHGTSFYTEIEKGPSPKKYHWHDIHDMRGSGSSGRSFQRYCHANGGSWVGAINDGTPDNAGEGAGTGAVVYHCCSIDTTYGECCLNGANACGTLNWELICCLGTMNKICCADQMMDMIQPYVLACAGTLGGAGGTGICHYTQKAGKGGGAGVSRSAILCICYGGSYDNCNGGATPLAFPPEELDWRVSNAGTGMAIIYWKDAD